MSAIEIVDVYTHCGLSKYEPIEEVRRVMENAGVGRAVLVQHMGEFDNTYIGQIVAEDPDHFTGVCLVDHTAEDCVKMLRQLAESGSFKGVRMTTDACRAAPQLMGAAAQLGLIIVLYAPEGITEFVDPLADFLSEHDSCRVVLTHMGTPDLAQAPQFQASRRAFQLAKYPGVYYQVSGMKMFCPHPHNALYDLIDQAVGQFGPSRLCWGSNFPVVGNTQDYDHDLHLLLDGKLPVPDDAIGCIAGANALELWFTKVRSNRAVQTSSKK